MIVPPKGVTAETKSARLASTPTRTKAEVPLTVVATDFWERRTVVLDSGPLQPAKEELKTRIAEKLSEWKTEPEPNS